MKKVKQVILICLLLISYALKAQVPGEQRGLYVNRFVSLFTSGSNIDDIDPANSILSTAQEDVLLQYCMENHITYISLYGLRNIFFGTSTQVNAKINDLRLFICKAKTEYCIQHVGSSGAFNNLDGTPGIGSSLRASNPFIFDDSERGTSLFDDLSFVEDENIQYDDPRFEVAENIKLALNLVNMNNPLYFSVTSTAPCQNIDVLTTEWEFWNGALFDDQVRVPARDNDDYNDLLFLMDRIRDNHSYDYYVETYLGTLEATNPVDIGLGVYTDPCIIAEYIDGTYTLGSVTKRRVDRILADYYHRFSDPSYSTFRRADKYLNRFLRFSESFDGSHSPSSFAGADACLVGAATADQTDYHPIFAANSVNLGAPMGSNFLGDYLQSASNVNIFTAERDFYDDFLNDGIYNVHGSSKSNSVAPGACQWYAQNYMVEPLDNPITFLAYTDDPCPTGSTFDVSLVYQGPIEAGITYRYIVLDGVNQPQIATGATLASGTTPVYSTVGGGLQPVHYSLSKGIYKASLTLTYATGCYYTYEQKIVVDSKFGIQALNSVNPLAPAAVCSGTPVFLQANWNVPNPSSPPFNYQWFLNGAAISNAINYNYTAPQSGVYHCTFNNGTCIETSNPITVTINDNPVRFLATGCTTGNNVMLTVVPSFGNDSYTWASPLTSTTLSDIATSTGTYSVTITRNSCVQVATKTVTAAMLTSNAYSGTTPTFTTTPSGSSFCPGTVVNLDANSTGAAGTFYWSTGETDDDIDILIPGVYTLITTDASGCNLRTNYTLSNWTLDPFSVTSSIANFNCSPSTSATLTASAGTGTGFSNYSWTPGGSTSSTLSITTPSTTPSSTTYTVIAEDSHGCDYSATTTINVASDCFTLEQAAVPTETYAGHPVTFSFEVCNNTGASHSVDLEDFLPPDFVLLSPATNPFTSSYSVSIPASPPCSTFTVTGFFVNIHDCSGPGSHTTHTNTVEMTPTGFSMIPSTECATIKEGCPMRIVGRSDCIVGHNAPIRLNIHNTLTNVSSIEVTIHYPSFLTPPTQLVLGSTPTIVAPAGFGIDPFPVSTIGPVSPSSLGTINGVAYNEVPVKVYYTGLVSSTIYDWFFEINFVYSNVAPNTRPNGQNVFLVAVDGDRSTVNISSSPPALTPTSPTSLWTQASDIYFLDCTGGTFPFIDASFTVSDPTCSNPGEFTFTANDVSSTTAIHIWELGDQRRTPVRGKASVTFDYLADYTDNTNVTQTRSNGNYTFKVKHILIDGNTFKVDSVTINVIGKLDATVSKTDNVCNNASAGTASVTASFGTSPYTYSWSTGATTQSIGGLHAGSYSVTVTDDSRCEKVVNFTITEPSSATLPSCVTASVSNTSCVTGTVVSWTAATGCVLGYNVYYGTNGGGTATPDENALYLGNVTSVTLPILNPGITYYYQVVPYDFNYDEQTGCSISSFTSGSSVTFTPTLTTPYLEDFESATVPSLPCGITMVDSNFPTDGFNWKTATGNSCGSTGSKHMIISKNSNNTTSKNDWFFSAPLNLSEKKLYRVQYDIKVDVGNTESIEVYISDSPDEASMTATSPISVDYITSSTCTTITCGDYVEYTTGVHYVGIRASSGANKGNIYIDNLKVSVVKTTNLTTSGSNISCGATLNSCDYLYYDAYSGATGFKFMFQNLDEGIQKEYTLTYLNSYQISTFLVSQANAANRLDMGKTYTVYMAATTGGGVYTPYGWGCEVTINPIPTTTLISSNCGSTITNLNNPVTTDLTNICGVLDYYYKFAESGGTPIETQRNSATATFLTVWIASPGVKYSTTYTAQVKLKMGNQWGGYGNTCTVSTGSSPLTELQSSYCSNYALPTFSSPVYSVAVPGAIDYKYHITGPNGYDKTFTKGNGLTTWIFSWTNAQTPHMVASTTYNVEVASNAGGVWSSYGNTCTITTPSSLSRMADTSTLDEFKESEPEVNLEESELGMNVYPNPTNNGYDFSIELSGLVQSNQKVKIKIFDLVGANLYKSEIITRDEHQFVLKPEIELLQGVYLIEAEVNGQKLRAKFVIE